jgi:hypothetical protein
VTASLLEKPDGTSRAYALRRLRKDRPDIARAGLAMLQASPEHHPSIAWAILPAMAY